MSLLPKAIVRVTEAFQRLPGIGPKTAQRLAFYLLHVPNVELERFSQSIANLRSQTTLCAICKNVSESEICQICADPSRNQAIICVTEQPTDVLAIEKTGHYRGVYHVLHGAVDPLNNIGPDEIYIQDLLTRIKSSQKNQIEEIVLATNPNMEGEATALYIQKQISHLGLISSQPLQITRLAHGLPVGAAIEYADEVTLGRALEGRRVY